MNTGIGQRLEVYCSSYQVTTEDLGSLLPVWLSLHSGLPTFPPWEQVRFWTLSSPMEESGLCPVFSAMWVEDSREEGLQRMADQIIQRVQREGYDQSAGISTVLPNANGSD